MNGFIFGENKKINAHQSKHTFIFLNLELDMLRLNDSNSRLGNHFFRAIAAHFIGCNTGINIKYYKDFSELGLKLCTNSSDANYNNLPEKTLTEDYFSDTCNYDELKNFNVKMMHLYCQTNYMSRKIIGFLKDNSTDIQSANPYEDRYQQNNDVFIHVRLDDVADKNPGCEYYEKILDSIDFDKGYISSDSIHHPICKKLIALYNLEIFNESEIKTWQFASTCKHVILSNGTFSWVIGALAFNSTVWYPKIKHVWHGDIFHKDIWNEVEV